MPKLCSFVLVLALAGSSAATGQSGPPVIGYGYTFPTPLYAAPGQLLTLVVQEELDSNLTQIVRAPGNADMPTTLAGISASYSQSTTRPAPILEVHPFLTCGGPVSRIACSSLLAITIQIPLDAQSCPQCSPLGGIAEGFLAVVQGGAAGLGIDVQPFADQVHIVTNCDPFMTSANSAAFNPTGLPCPSIVAHPDGSLVSVTNPATVGEELVAYAVGLGQTTPPSITGQLVTTSAPTQTAFILDFNYRPNALATKPPPNGPQPLFAGTTEGFVGLYQINFVVPAVPAGTSPCVDVSKLFPPGQNAVQSNLTVSVGGMFSFDGARICVAVPDPQSSLQQD